MLSHFCKTIQTNIILVALVDVRYPFSWFTNGEVNERDTFRIRKPCFGEELLNLINFWHSEYGENRKIFYTNRKYKEVIWTANESFVVQKDTDVERNVGSSLFLGYFEFFLSVPLSSLWRSLLSWFTVFYRNNFEDFWESALNRISFTRTKLYQRKNQSLKFISSNRINYFYLSTRYRP